MTDTLRNILLRRGLDDTEIKSFISRLFSSNQSEKKEIVQEFGFDLLANYINTLISDVITQSVNVATISDISPAFPEIIGTDQQQVQVQFTTRQDNLVCPICLPLDGVIFEIDDLSKPEIPDDTHPNCGCRWIILLDGVPQSG